MVLKPKEEHVTTQTTVVDFSVATLLVGFEVSDGTWKLAMSDKDLTRRIELDVVPGDREGVAAALGRAKKKLGLPEDAQALVFQEAGRQGFWIHRFLVALGVVSLVIDSSSIPVDRRQRRAKTDGLDAVSLLELVVRYFSTGGRARLARLVRAPTVDEEDARRMHRERERLVTERGAHQTRIKALLALCGTSVKDARAVETEDLRQWDGTALPPELCRELKREQERLLLVDTQVKALEQERSRRLHPPKPSKKSDKDASKKAGAKPLGPAQQKGIEVARQLAQFKGIGDTSAWLLAFELFWRQFDNRREVASATGLVPTPYNSGESTREQGISKAGNPLLRKVLVELAWSWLRYQPGSKLSRWFQERFAGGGSRVRRIGIVGVARRLVIDLWRYVTQGIEPEGAVLKVA